MFQALAVSILIPFAWGDVFHLLIELWVSYFVFLVLFMIAERSTSHPSGLADKMVKCMIDWTNDSKC